MKSVEQCNITLLTSVKNKAKRHAVMITGNKSLSNFISYLITDYDERMKKHKTLKVKQLKLEI